MLADLRYAIRTLRKSPGFLAVAVITLALGIGANTAMFSVVRAVLLSQLPYPQPDRLVQLWELRKDGGLIPVSGLNAQYWESQNRSLQGMTRVENDVVTMAGANAPVRVRISQVSRSFFPVLAVQPEIGRATVPADHREGASPVVLIGHGLWKRAFAGGTKALGSTVRLNGQTVTIVGVMPAGFDFPQKTEVWMPREIFPDHSTRSAHNFRVYGRLKPDVSLPVAQADMNTIASRLATAYVDDEDRGIRVVSLYEQIVGPVRPALLILLAAVGFVLLIACVNVANLQLSWAAARAREMALRGALGATRQRLIRQLLTEALLIAGMGGGAGLLLALWGTALLRAWIPANIPRIGAVQVDERVFVFALVLSLSSGIVFGLIPALLGSQTNVSEALQEGSNKASISMSQRRWGAALVVSEIAIAMVLLVGAGLLIQTLRNLENVDPGFAVNGVVTAEISWPVGSSEPDQVRAGDFTRRMLQKIQAIRGVEAAGVISSFPIKESGADGGFEIAGRALSPDPHQVPDALYRLATRGYFDAMKIPVERGRMFSEADERPDTPQVVLVNQAFVKEFFPSKNAIGQRIRFFGFDEKPQFMEIVGVLRDVRSIGLRRAAESEVFASGLQHPRDLSSATLAARASVNALAQIRDAIRSTDSDVPVEFESVSGLLADSVSREQFQTRLIALFAALALVLAAIGIYGVQAHTVRRRTGEMGIRVALGASRGDVVFLVLREAVGVSALGIGIGSAGAFLLTRTLSGFLYGISPTDPLVFIAIVAVLIAVTLLACWIPARRASRTDPINALRYE